MATLIDGTLACSDPNTVLAYCNASVPPIPTDWWGQANVFRVPMGRGPGTGGVLVRDFDLASLDLTIDHTLAFLDSVGNKRTLQKITFLKAECLSPGAPDNDNSYFFCEVVDRRWFLAQIPIDKAYNVAAADGLSYLSGTLNGAAAWTWQQVVDDIWSLLNPLFLLPIPAASVPAANPENLMFWGGMAWEALNQVLDRLACTIKYDIEADTFTILRLGDTAATAAVAATQLGQTLNAAQQKLWDSYWNEPSRGKLPEKVRVIFRRRPQPTDGTSDVYLVDITLPAAMGVATGTFLPLHDDLTAVGAGAPTNAAALATRAAERAADWLRKRLYNENRTTAVYRDFQDGMTFLAETTGAVAYDDRGMVMATEITSEPDGAMERFRAYEQPFVLSDNSKISRVISAVPSFPYSITTTTLTNTGQSITVTKTAIYLIFLSVQVIGKVTALNGADPAAVIMALNLNAGSLGQRVVLSLSSTGKFAWGSAIYQLNGLLTAGDVLRPALAIDAVANWASANVDEFAGIIGSSLFGIIEI